MLSQAQLPMKAITHQHLMSTMIMRTEALQLLHGPSWEESMKVSTLNMVDDLCPAALVAKDLCKNWRMTGDVHTCKVCAGHQHRLSVRLSNPFRLL